MAQLLSNFRRGGASGAASRRRSQQPESADGQVSLEGLRHFFPDATVGSAGNEINCSEETRVVQQV